MQPTACVDDEPFLVISGDALTDFRSDCVGPSTSATGAALTMALYRVPNPLEYGVINIDEDGRVAQFLEKPSWGGVTSDTVNTGIYVLEPEVLRASRRYPARLEPGCFPRDAEQRRRHSTATLPMATGATSARSASINARTPICSAAGSTWASWANASDRISGRRQRQRRAGCAVVRPDLPGRRGQDQTRR